VQGEEGHHEVPARQRGRCIRPKRQTTQNLRTLTCSGSSLSCEKSESRCFTEEEAEAADEVLVADDDGHGRRDREAKRAGDAHPGGRAVGHLLLLV
jgi:hypothetical protein